MELYRLRRQQRRSCQTQDRSRRLFMQRLPHRSTTTSNDINTYKRPWHGRHITGSVSSSRTEVRGFRLAYWQAGVMASQMVCINS